MEEKLLREIIQLLKDIRSGGNTSRGFGDNNAKPSTSDADGGNKKSSNLTSLGKYLSENLKKQEDYKRILSEIADKEKDIINLKKENNNEESIATKLAQNLTKLETIRKDKAGKYGEDQKKYRKKIIEEIKQENKLLLSQEKIINEKNELVKKQSKIEEEYKKKNKLKYKADETLQKIKSLKDTKTFQKVGEIAKDQARQLTGISGGFWGFVNKTLSSLWEQDSVMSKLSANYALSKKESGVLKQNITKAAIQTSVLGVKTADLVKMQTSYTDEVGRSVLLSTNGMIKLAEMGVATGIGAEGAAVMAAQFERFGYSVEETYNTVEDMVEMAKKSGVSSSVVSKKLGENLKIANSYTFKGGMKGVADMTVFSERLKINMSTIASFADKISTPEGAIQTAASLQVLGGSFAAMADPMRLLNQGITDMEGLTDTYSKMLKGVAKIDKQTGEVTINGYDRLRVKAAAEAMGVNFDEMMQSARLSAKKDAISLEIDMIPKLKNVDDDTKNIIASLAQFDKNKQQFTVNVNGKQTVLNDLTDETIKTLQPEDQSLNLRVIAQNTLGISDIIQNGFESLMATIVNKLMPVVNTIAEKLIEIFSKIAKILGGGGDGGGVVGSLTTGGKMVGKGLTNGLGKFGGDMLAKTIGKSKGKLGVKALGMAGKQIPVLGTLFDVGFAINDLVHGDWAGAGMNLAAGGAGLLDLVPGLQGVGTVASMGIDAANVARELGAFHKADDVYFPSKGKPVLLNSKDEVLAMKPGGAVQQALSPSVNHTKTYTGASPGYSGVYSSGGNNSSVNGNVGLNINGTINLTGGSTTTKLDINELLKDKNFVREISRIIGNQINRDNNGGKYSGSLSKNSID